MSVSETTVRLQRDGRGGYATPDGRFTVTQAQRGGLITDTSGARPFVRPTSTATFTVAYTDRLDMARLRIAAALRDGTSEGTS